MGGKNRYVDGCAREACIVHMALCARAKKHKKHSDLPEERKSKSRDCMICAEWLLMDNGYASYRGRCMHVCGCVMVCTTYVVTES